MSNPHLETLLETLQKLCETRRREARKTSGWKRCDGTFELCSPSQETKGDWLLVLHLNSFPKIPHRTFRAKSTQNALKKAIQFLQSKDSKIQLPF